MSKTSREIGVDHPRDAAHGITIVDHGDHFDKLPVADQIAHAVPDTSVDLSMTPQDRAQAVLDRSRHERGEDLIALDSLDYQSLYWDAQLAAKNEDEFYQNPEVFEKVRVAQKFNTPPTLGTHKDMEAIIQNGGTELFMRVPRDKLPEFYRGAYFPTESSGPMGMGTAAWKQRDNLDLPGRSPDDTQIVRMALLPEALTLDVDDLLAIRNNHRQGIIDDFHERSEPGDEWAAAEVRSRLWLMNDLGMYGLARGVEAVTSDHRVSILNSSVLLIQTDPIR